MTLRDQVAEAVWERRAAAGRAPSHMDRGIADAAIGVVLAAIAEEIEALPPTTVHPEGRMTHGAPHWVGRAEVLALLRDAGGAA